MTDKLRILLACPTFPMGPPVAPRSRESIEALRIPSDVELDVMWVSGDVQEKTHYQNLRDKQNLVRQKVLDEGYDYVFFVEADVIVPPDALEKLLEVAGPIAYGLYCGRLNKIWLCFTKLTLSKGESLVANPKVAKESWGKIIPSFGAHMGCTLIHRSALEAITFRLADGKETFASDWYFAYDAKREQIPQAHHLGVICGHIRRDGSVIWPTIEESEGRWKGWRTEEPDVLLPSAEVFECEIRKSLWLSSENRYALRGERHIFDKLTTYTLLGKKAVRLIREIHPVEVEAPKEQEDGSNS